jgi:hypothetical protein
MLGVSHGPVSSSVTIVRSQPPKLMTRIGAKTFPCATNATKASGALDFVIVAAPMLHLQAVHLYEGDSTNSLPKYGFHDGRSCSARERLGDLASVENGDPSFPSADC